MRERDDAVMEENQKREPVTVQETAEDGIRKDMQETAEDILPETVRTEERQKEKQSGGSMFEGIYDRLPDISVRSVDRFILLCIVAFIAVILIGVLKANHVF